MLNERGFKFCIVHNLTNQFGLSLENALESWIVRTDECTEESLVKYIKAKGNYIAMTEREYNNKKTFS